MAGKGTTIVVTLVLIVIALALSPTVGTFAASAAGNASGSASTIYNLIPFFWALLVLAIGAAAVYKEMH